MTPRSSELHEYYEKDSIGTIQSDINTDDKRKLTWTSDSFRRHQNSRDMLR